MFIYKIHYYGNKDINNKSTYYLNLDDAIQTVLKSHSYSNIKTKWDKTNTKLKFYGSWQDPQGFIITHCFETIIKIKVND